MRKTGTKANQLDLHLYKFELSTWKLYHKHILNLLNNINILLSMTIQF